MSAEELLPKNQPQEKEPLLRDGEGGPESGVAEYKERLRTALEDVSRSGDDFIEASERFTAFVRDRAPYRSTLGQELEDTEEYKDIAAAGHVAAEEFGNLLKTERSIQSLTDLHEAAPHQGELLDSMMHMGAVFQKTTRSADTLFGTATREQIKLAHAYRNETLFYEEEEFLKSAISLLRQVSEKSHTMSEKFTSYTKDFS